MTTSTEQIAELIVGYTDLKTFFQNKKTEINDAVTDAIKAIPELYHEFHVNQLSGSDSNTGTASEPFKTLRQAVDATPVGGFTKVFINGDYTTNPDSPESCVLQSKYIQIRGVLVSGVKPILTMSGSTYRNQRTIDRFILYGNSAVHFIDINLESDLNDVALPLASTDLRSIVTCYQTEGSPTLPVRFWRCHLNISDQTYILGGVSDSSQLKMLYLSACSTASSMPGRYIAGVSAGTASTTVKNLTTNLNTL